MKQKILVLLLAFCAISLLVFAEEPSIHAKEPAADPVFQKDGIAIKGYDTVAYFEKGKPEKGKEEFEHQWNGATWRFSSAANRDLFVKSPEKYAPQYGGYCAYGMANGYAAPVEPDVWKIIDGRLYLNYNAEVGRMWNQKTADYIVKADENWPKIPKKQM